MPSKRRRKMLPYLSLVAVIIMVGSLFALIGTEVMQGFYEIAGFFVGLHLVWHGKKIDAFLDWWAQIANPIHLGLILIPVAIIAWTLHQIFIGKKELVIQLNNRIPTPTP